MKQDAQIHLVGLTVANEVPLDLGAGILQLGVQRLLHQLLSNDNLLKRNYQSLIIQMVNVENSPVHHQQPHLDVVFSKDPLTGLVSLDHRLFWLRFRHSHKSKLSF